MKDGVNNILVGTAAGLFLSGCGGGTPGDSNESPEVVHSNFERLFKDGSELNQDSSARANDGMVDGINVEYGYDNNLFQDKTIRVIRIGTLHLSSGNLAIGDPGLLNGMVILKPGVPAGDYPVLVSNIGGKGPTAAVMVQFSTKKPVRWVASSRLDPSPNWLCKDPNRRHLDDNALGGRGATGCIVDSGVFSRIGVEGLKRIIPGEKANSITPIDSGSKENVLSFIGGTSDASYSVFYGLTEEKHLACLVVDCRMRWDSIVFATVHDLLSKSGKNLEHPYFKKHSIKIKATCDPSRRMITFEGGDRLLQEVDFQEGDSKERLEVKEMERKNPDTRVFLLPSKITNNTRSILSLGEEEPI